MYMYLMYRCTFIKFVKPQVVAKKRQFSIQDAARGHLKSILISKKLKIHYIT